MHSNKRWPNNPDFLFACLRRHLIPGGFKLPVLECLNDSLENFYIVVPRSGNAAIESPSDDWNVSSTLVNDPNSFRAKYGEEN
jgi:hypothetical protein